MVSQSQDIAATELRLAVLEHRVDTLVQLVLRICAASGVPTDSSQWIAPPHESTSLAALNTMRATIGERRDGRVVLQVERWPAPRDLDSIHQARHTLLSDGASSREGGPALERVRETLDEACSEAAGDALVQDVWVVPDGEGLAGAALRATGSEGPPGLLHERVIGGLVEWVSGGLGLEQLGEVLGNVGSKVPIPGDTAVHDLRRLVQVTGVVAGLMTGQPTLVLACVRSWAHDELTAKLAVLIGMALRTPPAGAEAAWAGHGTQAEQKTQASQSSHRNARERKASDWEGVELPQPDQVTVEQPPKRQPPGPRHGHDGRHGPSPGRSS